MAEIVKIGGKEYKLWEIGPGNLHTLLEVNAKVLVPVPKPKPPKKTIKVDGHTYVLKEPLKQSKEDKQ